MTTTLVGRNESGKSNLLRALHSLNPAEGQVALSRIKDFPRDRELSECNDDTPVVLSTWKLSPGEQVELAKVFPRSQGVTEVEIGRGYSAGSRTIQLKGLKPLAFDPASVAPKVDEIGHGVLKLAQLLDAAAQETANTVVNNLRTQMAAQLAPKEWGTAAGQALAALGVELAELKLVLEAHEDGIVKQLATLASALEKDDAAETAVADWIEKRLPVFILVDEYPEVEGHQNIAEYLGKKPKELSLGDINFQKLCKVSGLDPKQLQDLLAKEDQETRNQLTNRAGAVVTRKLKQLWLDRPLKIRFSPDGNHLDTLVSDLNNEYDVEVNLDERSRGLKWFFSFYVTFTADTQGGDAENAVLLLDEPGLYLHASSQGDLLRHLTSDFKNQVVYTTHSPFMVPIENLDAIRTVNIDATTGTSVTNDPSGDPKTLFPLQAALGFSLAQSLFVGPNNLVVEGVTDFWILSSISEYLIGSGKVGLPKELTLTPAGGAQKVPYMVALLTSEKLNVLVLLDFEKRSAETATELVKEKLIRDENVIFVTEGFATKPSEADAEDLIEPSVYDQLVQQVYAKELAGKSLTLNHNVPRIVKRYELAFETLGVEYHKSRAARLVLNLIKSDPAQIMTAATTERFERLFAEITKRFEKHKARGGKVFA